MALVLFKLVDGKPEQSLHDVMSLDERLAEGYKVTPSECEVKPKKKAKAKQVTNED